jgi:hypothetical protein
MKTVIIPDIHHHIEWANRIIDAHPDADEIVMLGDYFDCRPLKHEVRPNAKRVCSFLNETMQDRRVVRLMGNHDATYLFFHGGSTIPRPHDMNPNPCRFSCSGFSRSNALAVKKRLALSTAQSMKIAHVTQGHLLSHAGVASGYWFATLSDEEIASENAVDLLVERANATANPYVSRDSNTYWIGPARRGLDMFSGPLWCDFNMEFDNPTPLHQVVGHTSYADPRQKDNATCLDARQTTYGIIQDGQLSVHEP